MRLRQQGLDQLVHVVGWLLERIGGVDPVKDDVTGALVTQLERHLRLTCLPVHLGR